MPKPPPSWATDPVFTWPTSAILERRALHSGGLHGPVGISVHGSAALFLAQFLSLLPFCQSSPDYKKTLESVGMGVAPDHSKKILQTMDPTKFIYTSIMGLNGQMVSDEKHRRPTFRPLPPAECPFELI